MTDNAMTGTEHLMLTMETLNDLAAQLLGEPQAVINSIRRSGIMVPLGPALPTPETIEEREAVAEARLEFVRRRKAAKDAVRAAMEVVQGSLRELSKAEPVSARLDLRS